MSKKRRKFKPAFKARVALEALKEQKTLSELSKKYNLHPNQISQWKNQLKREAGGAFEKKNNRKEKSQQKLIEELYKQVGQLKVELDWVKKNAGLE